MTLLQRLRKVLLNGNSHPLAERLAIISEVGLLVKENQPLLAVKDALQAENVELTKLLQGAESRAGTAEQERDKLKHILRFILAGPNTTKSEMRYVIMTACEEFVKLYPNELGRSKPDATE